MNNPVNAGRCSVWSATGHAVLGTRRHSGAFPPCAMWTEAALRTVEREGSGCPTHPPATCMYTIWCGWPHGSTQTEANFNSAAVGHFEVARELLEHGADAHHSCEGSFPQHIVAQLAALPTFQESCLPAMHMLIENGLSMYLECVDLLSSSPSVRLHGLRACKAAHIRMSQYVPLWQLVTARSGCKPSCHLPAC